MRINFRKDELNMTACFIVCAITELVTDLTNNEIKNQSDRLRRITAAMEQACSGVGQSGGIITINEKDGVLKVFVLDGTCKNTYCTVSFSTE